MSFGKGWRTVGFGAAVAVVGVLQAADWATLVPPQYANIVMAAVGAAVVFLRMITSTSVGSK